MNFNQMVAEIEGRCISTDHRTAEEIMAMLGQCNYSIPMFTEQEKAGMLNKVFIKVCSCIPASLIPDDQDGEMWFLPESGLTRVYPCQR